MAAYVIVLGTPRADRSEDLMKYSQATESVRVAAGGKVIARGTVVQTVTGGNGWGMGIVLEFPDTDAAASFFAHDTYRSLIPLRDEIFERLEIQIVG